MPQTLWGRHPGKKKALKQRFKIDNHEHRLRRRILEDRLEQEFKSSKLYHKKHGDRIAASILHVIKQWEAHDKPIFQHDKDQHETWKEYRLEAY